MNDIFDKVSEFTDPQYVKKIAVLSGAGMSAESGIKTFRDSGGLWEEYSIYEVATPEAWARNPEMVQRFYNERRKQLLETEPNAGHFAIAELQEKYDVQVITQNVDDLHERAGSQKVLHLHGELRKSRSSSDESLIYDIEGWEIKMGDCCEKGSQLRPHVVWFGEMVPMIEPATELVQEADLVLVVGTSLAVYPAAGLLNERRPEVPAIAIDPADLDLYGFPRVYHIKEKATVGLKKLTTKMLAH